MSAAANAAEVIAGLLPDWWKTIDPEQPFDYAALRASTIELVSLSPEDRRAVIKELSRKYTFPKMDPAKASGIYVLLRLAFAVPESYPREDAKYFGSWARFGAGDDDTEMVNLAWPVQLSGDPPEVTVARFDGYSGKGYDALGEYKYFAARFKRRTVQSIEKMVFPEPAS